MLGKSHPLTLSRRPGFPECDPERWVLGTENSTATAKPQWQSWSCRGFIQTHSVRPPGAGMPVQSLGYLLKKGKNPTEGQARACSPGEVGGGKGSRLKEQHEQRLRGLRWGEGWDWEESGYQALVLPQVSPSPDSTLHLGAP